METYCLGNLACRDLYIFLDVVSDCSRAGHKDHAGPSRNSFSLSFGVPFG